MNTLEVFTSGVYKLEEQQGYLAFSIYQDQKNVYAEEKEAKINGENFKEVKLKAVDYAIRSLVLLHQTKRMSSDINIILYNDDIDIIHDILTHNYKYFKNINPEYYTKHIRKLEYLSEHNINITYRFVKWYQNSAYSYITKGINRVSKEVYLYKKNIATELIYEIQLIYEKYKLFVEQEQYLLREDNIIYNQLLSLEEFITVYKDRIYLESQYKTINSQKTKTL